MKGTDMKGYGNQLQAKLNRYFLRLYGDICSGLYFFKDLGSCLVLR